MPQIVEAHVRQTGTFELHVKIPEQVTRTDRRAHGGSEDKAALFPAPSRVQALFQLAHLYLTDPRFDPAAVGIIQERLRQPAEAPETLADTALDFAREGAVALHGVAVREGFVLIEHDGEIIKINQAKIRIDICLHLLLGKRNGAI